MSNLTEDFWAWVDIRESNPQVEPGLYASQSRPALATGQYPSLTIITFYSAMPTITLAFNTAVNGIGYDLNNGFYGEGHVGNWGRDKNSICYMYHERNDFLFPEEGESWWVGWVDTSYRPLPQPIDHPFNLGTIFVNHQQYFWVTGAGLTSPRYPRYVPPNGDEICFTAHEIADVEFSQANPGTPIPRSLYFIPSDVPVPTVTSIITADDLHTGANEISFATFSTDGRWLAAQVDDRLVIVDRSSNTVVLDIVESSSLPYQFSNDAGILYYVKNGVLNIRRWVDGWALYETSTISTEYSCGGVDAEANWGLPRYSPNSQFWYNGWEGGCGGVFDFQYRNMSCIYDEHFFEVSECQVGGGFTLGIPFGDFSNDSRWYVGGDGNINGGSKAILGPGPEWIEGVRQSASAAVQMRSFQAF